jgi:hypothetical protein
MAKKQDWLDLPEIELVNLMKIWVALLELSINQTAYMWPANVCATVVNLLLRFEACRVAYAEDNSSKNHDLKKAARAAAEKGMRDFAREYVRYNHLVPDEVKKSMGLHEADTTRTEHKPPELQPETSVEGMANRNYHKVWALNTMDAKNPKSKPKDADGVCFGVQIGGERPKSGKDLKDIRYSRKIFLVYKFGEELKGQTVYYATCYMNEKGEQGEWSEIVEAVIG